jgi:hypothetical protein
MLQPLAFLHRAPVVVTTTTTNNNNNNNMDMIPIDCIAKPDETEHLNTARTGMLLETARLHTAPHLFHPSLSSAVSIGVGGRKDSVLFLKGNFHAHSASLYIQKRSALSRV